MVRPKRKNKKCRDCCVLDCEDRTSIRHRFPRNPELYKAWVKNVNHPRLGLEIKTKKTVYQTYYVCHRHFSNKYRNPDSRGISKNAIPTLYLTGNDVEPTPRPEKPRTYSKHSKFSHLTVNRQPNKKDYSSVRGLPLFKKKEVSYKLEKVQDNLITSFKLVPIGTKITFDFQPTITCRLCLTQNRELVSLFNKNTVNGKKLLYKEMLVECASVKIEEHDKLPKGICSQCIEKLNSSYKFRKLCEKSENTLNDFFNKSEDNSSKISKENTSNNDKECVEENVINIQIVEDRNLVTILEPEFYFQNFENVEDKIEIVEDRNSVTILESESYLQNVENVEDKIEIVENEILETNLKFEQNSQIYENEETIKDIDIVEDKKTVLESITCSQIFENEEIVENVEVKIEIVENNILETDLKIETNSQTSDNEEISENVDNTEIIEDVNSSEIVLNSESNSQTLNTNKEVIENVDNVEIIADKSLETVSKSTLQTVENKKSVKNQKQSVDKVNKKKTVHYICKICNINFKRYCLLIAHLKNTHKNLKSYRCQMCLKKFNSIQNLYDHMKRHTLPKRFKCTICTRAFKHCSALKSHLRVHTGEKFSCNICNKSFGRKHYLINNHMKRHSESDIYLCTVCGKNLRGPKLLKIHMFKHSGDRNYICEICGKVFTVFNNFKLHNRTHTGEKPFSCTKCGKSFSNRGGLKVHMKTHSDIRSYLCQKCGMSFKTAVCLSKHRFVHVTEKLHSCNLCTKKFASHGSLLIHLKVHKANRNYICKYCNQGFHRSDYLKTHTMSMHTGERPHTCQICGVGFVQRGTLKKHLQTH